MTLTDSTTTATTTVDGVDVTYFDSGPGPEADSRPLVLVHGTGGSTATHFGHLYPMMATRTRVVAVDWAPRPKGEKLSVETLARQVMGCVDAALGSNAQFDLLGYSLGAVVAQHIAAEQRGRVSHLVTVAGWITTDQQQRLRNSVWHTLYEQGHEALAKYTLFCAASGPYLRSLDDAVIAAALGTLAPSEFTADQMALNAEIDLASTTQQISAGTLIVSCTDDMMVPPHHQNALLGAIPDARLTTITSGHAFFIERPAELMQIVDLYLRDPDRYSAGSVIPETAA